MVAENITLENATVDAPTEMDATVVDGAVQTNIRLQIRIIFSYMQLVTGILIILANLALLICFIKFNFLKRKPNIYIFSLCVSDLMAGLAAILVSCLNSFVQRNDNYRKDVCVFSAVFHYFTVVTSLYSMLCAAFERYIHIAHPFLHAKHSENWIHMGIVLVGWFNLAACSVILGYPNIAQHGTFCYLTDISKRLTISIIFPLTTLPQIIAIAVVMLLILKLIHKHSKAIDAIEQLEMRLAVSSAVRIKSERNESKIGLSTSHGVSIQGENNLIIDCEVTVPTLANTKPVRGTLVANTRVDNKQGARTAVVNNPVTELPAFKKVNRSRTNMVVVLLIITLFCWIPVILIIILRLMLVQKYKQTIGWAIYGEFSVFMMTFNSLLNPFSYQRFSPDIKKAYRALMQ